jgi:hypothetical protein
VCPGSRVHDTVDEQGRGATNLARGDPAFDVAAHTPEHGRSRSLAVKQRDVELELGCVSPEVLLLECLLAVEEQLMHVPEAMLEGGCLGCCRRGERVRMDLGEGKVAKGEADVAKSPLDLLDFSKRLARVRALVVAVLEDHATTHGSPNVIDLLVERLDRRLMHLRHDASDGLGWPGTERR